MAELMQCTKTSLRQILFIFGFCMLSCKNTPSPPEMHKNQDVTSDQSTADSGHKTETHLSSHTVISKDSTTVTNHDLTPGTGINKEDIPKPKGYVIRDNTFLHAFSDTASKKLKRLQKGEFIYLLETSLTNEKGEMVSYPTWYKVTVADKMTGWVRSDHVSFGH